MRKVWIALAAVGVVVALGVACAIALSLVGDPEEETCHDRLTPGPNSNTSRLNTTLDIPASEWAEVSEVLHQFARDNAWSLREGDGTTDSTYRWLRMCNEEHTHIRAGNFDGEGGKIGFGIIHMEYTGPARDGWHPFYRDLHQRLESRWPNQMTYIEGEFGRTIDKPAWLINPN